MACFFLSSTNGDHFLSLSMASATLTSLMTFWFLYLMQEAGTASSRHHKLSLR